MNVNRKEKPIELLRQGDVLLVPVESAPEGAKQVKRQRGRLILAEGEATGHAHAILDREAKLVSVPAEEEELVTADQAAELYLIVHGTGPVNLVHEEHGRIAVPPGVHKVTRQREYSPEAIRQVSD